MTHTEKNKIGLFPRTPKTNIYKYFQHPLSDGQGPDHIYANLQNPYAITVKNELCFVVLLLFYGEVKMWLQSG